MLDPCGRREVLDTVHRLNRERGHHGGAHHPPHGRGGGRRPGHRHERRRSRPWTARPGRSSPRWRSCRPVGLTVPDTVELLRRLNRRRHGSALDGDLRVDECARRHLARRWPWRRKGSKQQLEPIIQYRTPDPHLQRRDALPAQRGGGCRASTCMPGEFLGIIGHTGSGKSTLIQHLNGLLQPHVRAASC